MSLTMNAPIDRVEIGVGLRRYVELMNTSDDYMKVVMPQDGSLSVAARIDGLRGGALSFGNPLRLQISKLTRPFRIEAYGLPGKWDLRGVVQVNDLPSEIDLTVSPNSSPIVSWNASGPIGRLEANLSDSAPLFGRVTVAKLLATAIPQTLSLSTVPNGSGFDLNANGASIGSIEAVFSSSEASSNERMPAGQNGVLIRDEAAAFNAAVRMTNLRRAFARFRPGCNFAPSDCTSEVDATIDSGGGDMHVHLRGRKPSGAEEATSVDLAGLPSSASFSMRDRVLKLGIFGIELSLKRDITYRGSSAGGGVHLFSNTGPRVYLDVNLAPLPATVDLCTAIDHACYPSSGGPAIKGSMRYSASQHATLDLVDCVTSNCHSINKTGEYTHVRNLYVRYLATELDPRSAGVLSTYGHAIIDTDGHELRGDLLTRGSDGKRTELYLGAGFWAQDRRVDWDNNPFAFRLDRSGSINCSPGTGFYVPTIGDILINVGAFIC